MNKLMIPEKNETSLQDFYYVVLRHKKKMIWVFLSVTVAVALVTMFMPRTYLSEAKLLVRLGRESASMDPTATTSGQVVQVNQRRESEIKSEMEIIKSRDLAEKVVDKVGPEAIIRKSLFSFSSDSAKLRNSAIKQVMQTWDISSDKDSNIINIAYQAKSPQVAHDVVAALIDAYLAKHLEVNRTAGSYDFFKKQTDKSAVQLAEIEKRLAGAKNQVGLTSLDDQRRIIQERVGIFQKDLEQTTADYKVSQAKMVTLREQLAKLPESIVTNNTAGFPNSAADGMRQKLYDLQLKEQELLSKYTEKNFLVQETRRQINNAQALLKREVPTRAQVTKGLNAAHEQAKLALVSEEANCAGLQSKAQALAATLTDVNRQVRDFNTNEGTIAQLQREREILDSSYREYSKKMEQSRIDSALETGKISNISVAQAATYPLAPAKPSRALNMALGILLGAMGAVGLAYYRERTDTSFRKIEDVETRLHLPVLTAIPLFKNKIGFSGETDERLPLPDNDLLGKAKECFEILGHRLLTDDGVNLGYPQVIGVISCYSNEGVSTVAGNLAESLASRNNQRVLFVEANMVTPSAHMNFGIQNAPGLTDFIAEKNDVSASIKTSNRSKLEIIPSGHGGITVSQLADSLLFPEMLEVLKNEYSYVVVDLPPVFKSISALRLAGQTDGVILVLGAEGVSWQVAQEAQNLLERAKANVIGVVLNKQQYHIPEWLQHLTT
jgi:capsular exopolysaccharide synthesis family protein